MKAEMMKFWKDEDGATAIEYGLIAGLIVVLVAAVFQLLTGGLTALFTNISNRLSAAG